MIMRNLITVLLLVMAWTLSAQQLIQAEEEVSAEQLQEEFLAPSFQAEFLGTSYLTRNDIERNLQIKPFTHRGGKDFYNIAENNVTMGYSPEQVCVFVSFRLFADEALEYQQELINIFSLVKQKEAVSLEMDRGIQGLQSQIRYYKKGDVVCEVYDGSYISFTYYTQR